MRPFVRAAAVALLALSGAAYAQELSLTPGQAVTATFDESWQFAVIERRPARTLSEFEHEVAAALEDNKHAMGPNVMPIIADDHHIPLVTPHHIMIDMIAMPNGQTLLSVSNGFADRDLSYRAMINDGVNTTYTDVCTVLAGRFSTEHWPYPIAQLDLSAFQLELPQLRPTCR